MNKIVFNIGLLIFFVSVIYFSQRSLPIEDIIIRSMVVFVAATIMISFMTILFIRAINKTAISRRKNISENIGREL